MRAIERAWYRPYGWTLALLPLTGVFYAIARVRRWALCRRYNQRQFPVPVVVVGNIAVGGTGKTPLIIALVEQLRARGYRPGVVSRGYGGSGNRQPLVVTADTAVEIAGDEAVVVVRATNCPVVICADRCRAIAELLKSGDCDLVLSDDGLQHYRMYRDMEVAVVDGARGFGNGFCLPAGPLREPVARLRSVDAVIINGEMARARTVWPGSLAIQVRPARFRHLASGKVCSPGQWALTKTVHAMAGIGNPQRFADTLAELGFSATLQTFPDHYKFRREDFQFADGAPVIVTSKDAVKCEAFVDHHIWVLEVTTEVPESLLNDIEKLSNKIDYKSKVAN